MAKLSKLLKLKHVKPQLNRYSLELKLWRECCLILKKQTKKSLTHNPLYSTLKALSSVLALSLKDKRSL